jgi:hypothetical protein
VSITTNKAPIDGLVDDMSFGGLAASFPLSRPALGLGQKIEISLKESPSAEPLVASATVMHREDSEQSRKYGFCFSRPDQIQLLEGRLSELVNVRDSYRITPGSNSPVEVKLATKNGIFLWGSLFDISSGGIGVRIPAPLELELARQTHTDVCFTLPNDPGNELRFKAIIRTRQIVDDVRVHIGLEFDLENSEDGDRQHAIVLDFVKTRQTSVGKKIRQARRDRHPWLMPARKPAD